MGEGGGLAIDLGSNLIGPAKEDFCALGLFGLGRRRAIGNQAMPFVAKTRLLGAMLRLTFKEIPVPFLEVGDEGVQGRHAAQHSDRCGRSYSAAEGRDHDPGYCIKLYVHGL